MVERFLVQETIANTSSSGVKGSVRFDGKFLYVCVDTDTWLRTNLTRWGR
jgi:hypothetical protein